MDLECKSKIQYFPLNATRPDFLGGWAVTNLYLSLPFYCPFIFDQEVQVWIRICVPKASFIEELQQLSWGTAGKESSIDIAKENLAK